MSRLLTTAEAAKLSGIDRRSFARWAREHNLKPLDRVRIGRSFVTVWSERDLLAAAGCLTN